MRKGLILLLSLAYCGLYAQIIPLRLPSVISDHAVLQQSSEVSIRGWGPPTLEVNIVCSWCTSDTIKVMVKNDCTWKTKLKTPKAGEGYNIQFFVDKDKIVVSDISIGEVWLSAGQSNMAMKTREDILDAGDLLKEPENNKIRFFQVENTYDIYPHSDVRGKWIVCDSSTVKNFSAVAFFFGYHLQKTLHVPVGLINASWGATSIQPWMPETAFDSVEEMDAESHFGTAWAPQATSILYNTMIYPLTPFQLAGIIWYQGESNALVMNEALNYGKLLKKLICSWRKTFEADLPFYYVQIAPFDGYYPKDAAAYLREQQELVLQVHKTGMITIGDLVNDVKDIHPRLKAGVGRRIANLVLKEQYGLVNLQPYSPKFLSVKLDNQKAVISVKSIGRLRCKDNKVSGFKIAGVDKIFCPAMALINHNGEIIVKSNLVKNPVAVRYCFTNEEVPDLFDTNGLPLMPFRTDNW